MIAPNNNVASIILAVLKYIVKFINDNLERDIAIFLLIAIAISMLYKRGATISIAKEGYIVEVGVACLMAIEAFTAYIEAKLETIK